jgi:large subunit ribosomal protein L24
MTTQIETKMKIKKGDQVIVLTGKDKGQKGEVLKAMPKEQRVLVKGINLVKKHRRPSATNPGGIDTIEASIHVSNVALIDPKSGKATRAGYTLNADGTKTRIARKSGEAISAASAK